MINTKAFSTELQELAKFAKAISHLALLKYKSEFFKDMSTIDLNCITDCK